jgi:fumarate hydratase subunit beta
MRDITFPASDETIRALHSGDAVTLTGTMITARDTAHKWMVETFIKKTRQPQGDDLSIYEQLQKLLNGSTIYHCGPVVAGLETKEYRFVAAGPTTSTREEPYQADVMKHFNVKGVIGKGGMGDRTLKGCAETPAVYLHAIGGAATFLAERVVRVLDVFKLKEFGVPEALWVIEVQQFPVVVTMDSHGVSLHAEMAQKSKQVFEELLEKPY